MLRLKKIYRDELLQVALLLSLLRVDPGCYLEDLPAPIGVGTDDSWDDFGGGGGGPPRFHIHPKAVDIFDDLNGLGRYNRIELPRNITAYLLNVDSEDANSAIPVVTAPAAASLPNSSDAELPPGTNNAELSPEDVNLIEVLWKQDVDLGFSIPGPDEKEEKVSAEDQEKLKVLESLKEWSPESSSAALKDEPEPEEDEPNPWAGLDYTVDMETGEYVLKDELDLKEEIARDLGIRDGISGDPLACPTSENGSDIPCLSLEEALQLVGLEDQVVGKRESDDDEGNVSDEGEASLSPDMIQTAQFHPPHPPGPPHHPHAHPHSRPFQGRMPYVRAMSMEQRWQDLANLLSLPSQEGGHHPFVHPAHAHHAGYPPHGYLSQHDSRSVLLHNASLAPPVGELAAAPTPYGSAAMASSNIGSAVATSMNLTNSSEPISDSGSVFKMENPHDLMYYQNSTTEMNQTTEGLLSSILNDEDLQLMDMAMTEGMYPMRLLESNSSNNASGPAPGHTEERLDASSDSAVSSMGSERVPSLSDGEWMETGSDSGHNTGDHYGQIDYSVKFRPFDYSYSSRQLLGAAAASTSADPHIPPVAQKKHHMFGKRYFQEQGASSSSSLVNHRGLGPAPPSAVKFEYNETGAAGAEGAPGFVGPMDSSCTKMSDVKFSCSLDFARHQPAGRCLEQIHHNHTYSLPVPADSLALGRPTHRDKARQRKLEEEHLTRDEKRANAMSIPIPVEEIVNLPMDEFNERLSKFDLSEAQLSLIRDIRRRGKNKVAAQNCRKRKLDQIVTLADEVKQMRDRKHRLLRERDYMLAERLRVKEKFSQLYRHVFQALRDPDGNQYSPYEYSLQQSADGTVVLVPRASSNLLDEARSKHKDSEPKE